jgi:adenylate cyclase
MTDIFISYARSTEAQAKLIAEALKTLGCSVWRDDDLPAHRAYAEVIEERLKAARAVVVIWSAEAVKSEWVRSEADRARAERKLIQLTIDGAALPMPFDQIQCADMTGWTGDTQASGWRKIVDSLTDLMGRPSPSLAPPALAPAPALPNKPSIAVLPFIDMTGAGDQDYFVDGMMEEIVSSLSRYRSLFVIASGSTMAFKGRSVGPQEVGRVLGVRYVLEGSVRKAANRVRITVKLVDAADGAQIWGERFEDTLDDIFALQDRVSLSVAGVLEPAVREAEIKRLAQRPTANMGSYDLYLRAMAVLRTYVWSDIFEAIKLADQAIALDPEFGAALSLASRCHYLVVLYGWSDDPEPHRRDAIALSRRAMRAAPDDADVLACTSMLAAYLEHDLQTGMAMADRACALNPGAASAWYASGSVRILADQLDRAAEHLETSMRLNPIGPGRSGAMLFLAMARFQQKRFDEAVALANEIYRHFENPTGCAILAASYGHLGRGAAAREALAHYKRLSPQTLETYARSVWQREHHLKLFLDGIALAEGSGPTATTS